MVKTRILLAAAVVAAMGMAGCNTMKSMTGGGHTQSVTLSGANEVPAVNTSASGTGNVTVGADRMVTANITVTGMNATAAHIHVAAVGQSGPPIITLTRTTDDVWSVPADAKLTDEQYEQFVGFEVRGIAPRLGVKLSL